MRVLVCGGRDYEDDIRVSEVLTALLRDRNPTMIIAGCARGADEMAHLWASANHISRLKFFANWQRYGRMAGPIRNQQMIDEGRPDLVIAFPGGRGTADMVKRAHAAGIEVVEVA